MYTILETRELLKYLEKMEISLSSFSFGELGTVEAVALKKSFDHFKQGLEEKIYGTDGLDQLTALCDKVGIHGLDNKGEGERPLEGDALEPLVEKLENTPLNKEQREIVNAMKKLAQKTTAPKGLPRRNKDLPSPDPYLEFIEMDLGLDPQRHHIGLKPVLDECMGHMDLMEEVVRIFKQNLLEFIGATKIQLERGDMAALDLACQKVMPSLRMMKAHGLMETAGQMAVQCRTEQDLKYLEFLYEQFIMEFPGIQEQVDFEMEILRTM